MSLNQIKLAVVMALMITSFVAGWQVHSWKVDARTNAQAGKDIKQSIQAHNTSKDIITKRDAAEVKERIVYRTIREKVNALPTDNICFSPESLQLWNSAIQGADSNRPESSKETTAVDSVATEKDILTNAAENFETCRVNSINHNALIDKVESLNGKMCYCETE